jgi:hypothetical protein
MDRDETYMPPTRKAFKLPDAKVAVQMDYHEILEETPAFTLFKLVIRQILSVFRAIYQPTLTMLTLELNTEDISSISCNGLPVTCGTPESY